MDKLSILKLQRWRPEEKSLHMKMINDGPHVHMKMINVNDNTLIKLYIYMWSIFKQLISLSEPVFSVPFPKTLQIDS